MKKVYIKTNYPIPSCVTNRLIWNEENKEWEFEFEVKIQSKFDLGEKPLYLYGHISQLKLVENVTKGSINLTINSLDEIESLLEKQAISDRKYREAWIKENPDYYENVKTIEVKNETQKSPVSHIIAVRYQSEDSTTFIISPKKGE